MILRRKIFTLKNKYFTLKGNNMLYITYNSDPADSGKCRGVCGGGGVEDPAEQTKVIASGLVEVD